MPGLDRDGKGGPGVRMKGELFVVGGASYSVVNGEGLEFVWDDVEAEDDGEGTNEVSGVLLCGERRRQRVKVICEGLVSVSCESVPGGECM